MIAMAPRYGDTDFIRLIFETTFLEIYASVYELYKKSLESRMSSIKLVTFTILFEFVFSFF